MGAVPDPLQLRRADALWRVRWLETHSAALRAFQLEDMGYGREAQLTMRHYDGSAGEAVLRRLEHAEVVQLTLRHLSMEKPVLTFSLRPATLCSVWHKGHLMSCSCIVP